MLTPEERRQLTPEERNLFNRHKNVTSRERWRRKVEAERRRVDDAKKDAAVQHALADKTLLQAQEATRARVEAERVAQEALRRAEEEKEKRLRTEAALAQLQQQHGVTSSPAHGPAAACGLSAPSAAAAAGAAFDGGTADDIAAAATALSVAASVLADDPPAANSKGTIPNDGPHAPAPLPNTISLT